MVLLMTAAPELKSARKRALKPMPSTSMIILKRLAAAHGSRGANLRSFASSWSIAQHLGMPQPTVDLGQGVGKGGCRQSAGRFSQ